MRDVGLYLVVASFLAAGITAVAEEPSLVLKVVDKHGKTVNVRDAKNVGEEDTGEPGAPETVDMGGLMLLRGPAWVLVPWTQILKVTVYAPEEDPAGHALRCPVDLARTDGTEEELHMAEGMNNLSGKTDTGPYKIDLVKIKELTRVLPKTLPKKP